jgi:hypothetical protein
MSSMVQAPIDAERRQEMVGRKYCRNCWREDEHLRVVRVPQWAQRPLRFITFGQAHRVLPSRCVCCGTLRFF